MVYTAFKDGYLRESTFGTSLITTAGDTTYKFGVIGKEAKHPNPRTTLLRRATGVNAQELESGVTWKTIESLFGTYTIGMQNAVLIQAIMGKSATTGPVGNIYTHTITPPTPVSGILPLLPSFTIHHERTGTSTDWAIQYRGCKVMALTLNCGETKRYLTGIVDWIAQTAVDPNLDGTNAMLTNDPALPTTSNESPYHFNNMTRTFDGNAIDGLIYMELNIVAGLEAELAHTWDGGTYTGRKPKSFIEGSRKQYQLIIDYHPESDDLWDELVATGNTKDIVFKWTRDTDDYIQATLTDCHVIEHEIKTPDVEQSLIERVIIEPRAISFEVKDKLVGGIYGE